MHSGMKCVHDADMVTDAEVLEDRTEVAVSVIDRLRAWLVDDVVVSDAEIETSAVALTEPDHVRVPLRDLVTVTVLDWPLRLSPTIDLIH